MKSITVDESHGYLTIHVKGKDSLSFSLEYWRKIGEICRQKNVNKVLVIEELEGQISVSDMFALCEQLPKLVGGIDIAFIDIEKEHSKDNLFGETVARNRGCNIKDFTDEHQAAKWLLNE